VTIEQAKPTQPDVPDYIFSEGKETEEQQWQVFPNSIYPVMLDDVYSALEHTEWTTELGDKGIIPESVELTMVSFYCEGTLLEVYLKAAEMCEYLNSQADIPDSSWEFERGSIVVVE
jgi:hypothetical protein